jgi:hypothetical protein
MASPTCVSAWLSIKPVANFATVFADAGATT